MKIAPVPVLVLLMAVTSHAQPVDRVDDATRVALIPLFVSCDLTAEFITPGMEEREVRWLETPVSREGARLHERSHARVTVTPVPLVLDAHALRMQHSPAAPFDARGQQGNGHIRLLASVKPGLYTPAKVAMPARTGSSTWVRIRALYDH